MQLKEHFWIHQVKSDTVLAVAHGMLVEAKISVLMHLLPKLEFEKIQEVLRAKFEIRRFSEKEFERFIELMRQDKKRVDSSSRFTLLKGIGEGVYDVQVTDEITRKALEVFNESELEA